MRCDLRSLDVMHLFRWSNSTVLLTVFAQWPLLANVPAEPSPSTIVALGGSFMATAIASFTEVFDNCSASAKSLAHPSQPASDVVEVGVSMISDDSSELMVTATFAGV